MKPPRVPPPPVPRRPLPAPTRGPAIEVTSWAEEESDTGETNQALATYQSLLSVFDALAPDERLEFVELAAVYSTLSPEARETVLRVARGLG